MYDPAKVAAEVWSLSDSNGLSPKVKPASIDVATLIVSTSHISTIFPLYTDSHMPYFSRFSSASQLYIQMNGSKL